MKRCSYCQQEKPYDAFYRNRAAKDGYSWRCKLCMGLATEKYRTSPKGRSTIAKNLSRPEVKTARYRSHRKYITSPKGRAKTPQYRRKYYVNGGKEKVYAYTKTEGSKATARRRGRRYRAEGRYVAEKRARNAVQTAIRRGTLPPIKLQTCACGQPAVHWHHHLGYAPEHWLHVIPICGMCHYRHHHPEYQ